MTELIWEEPPVVRKTTKWDEVIEQLKMKPNQWARISTSEGSGAAYSRSNSIRKAAKAMNNGTTIETRVATIGETEVRAYARYVPRGRA